METTDTLYQVLFGLQLDICDRFNLSPFQLRRERLSEVCLLVSRLNDHAKRKGKGKKSTDRIRRPAGDSWF